MDALLELLELGLVFGVAFGGLGVVGCGLLELGVERFELGEAAYGPGAFGGQSLLSELRAERGLLAENFLLQISHFCDYFINRTGWESGNQLRNISAGKIGLLTAFLALNKGPNFRVPLQKKREKLLGVGVGQNSI